MAQHNHQSVEPGRYIRMSGPGHGKDTGDLGEDSRAFGGYDWHDRVYDTKLDITKVKFRGGYIVEYGNHGQDRLVVYPPRNADRSSHAWRYMHAILTGTNKAKTAEAGQGRHLLTPQNATGSRLDDDGGTPSMSQKVVMARRSTPDHVNRQVSTSAQPHAPIPMSGPGHGKDTGLLGQDSDALGGYDRHDRSYDPDRHITTVVFRGGYIGRYGNNGTTRLSLTPPPHADRSTHAWRYMTAIDRQRVANSMRSARAQYVGNPSVAAQVGNIFAHSAIQAPYKLASGMIHIGEAPFAGIINSSIEADKKRLVRVGPYLLPPEVAHDPEVLAEIRREAKYGYKGKPASPTDIVGSGPNGILKAILLDIMMNKRATTASDIANGVAAPFKEAAKPGGRTLWNQYEDAAGSDPITTGIGTFGLLDGAAGAFGGISRGAGAMADASEAGLGPYGAFRSGMGAMGQSFLGMPEQGAGITAEPTTIPKGPTKALRSVQQVTKGTSDFIRGNPKAQGSIAQGGVTGLGPVRPVVAKALKSVTSKPVLTPKSTYGQHLGYPWDGSPDPDAPPKTGQRNNVLPKGAPAQAGASNFSGKPASISGANPAAKPSALSSSGYVTDWNGWKGVTQLPSGRLVTPNWSDLLSYDGDGWSSANRETLDQFGSARDGTYIDKQPLHSLFPELVGVNPHYVDGARPGVNTNCHSVTNAVHARLTGTDPGAIADNAGYAIGENALLPSANFGFGPPTTPEGIVNEMIQAREGATRPVIIEQPGGIHHSLNVVNRGGKAHFVDGQSGHIVTINPDLTVKLGRPNNDPE